VNINVINNCLEPSVEPEQEAEVKEAEKVAKKDVSMSETVSAMLIRCLGTDEVNFEYLHPNEINVIGNYCWNRNVPELNLFTLRLVASRKMHDKVVLLGRSLIKLERLSGSDLEECRSILRESLFEVPPYIRLSGSFYLHNSSEFSNNFYLAPFNPFSRLANKDILKQKNLYYTDGSYTHDPVYRNYYNFGY
jgi:hypothetical protein